MTFQKKLFLVGFVLLLSDHLCTINGSLIFKSEKVNLDGEKSILSSSGKVFIIGGATKDDTSTIYNALREATGKANPNIAVAISAAGSLAIGFEAYYENIPGSLSYEQLFKNYGFTPNVIQLAIDNYQTASSSNSTIGAENIRIINNADVVFFNGGDQSRHSRSWLNTDGSDSDIMKALRVRFAEGLVVAGTSAGGAIMSDPTYGEGYSYGYYYFNADLKSCKIGETLADDRDGTNSFRYDENGGLMKGFGFVNDAVVDTHFDARGRFGRMGVAMRQSGKTIGIGVGEDTTLYINQKNAIVYGNDGVWIADSSNAKFPSETYFAVQDLKISYLTEGDRYNFDTKSTTSTKSPVTTGSGITYESDDVFGDHEGIKSITSLVTSADTRSVGYSYEENPTARVVFYKGKGEKAYKTGNKYTIDGILMDIGTK